MTGDKARDIIVPGTLSDDQKRILEVLAQDQGDVILPILEVRLNRSLAEMVADLNALESKGLLSHDPPLNLVEHLFSPMYRFALTNKGKAFFDRT